MGGMRACNKIGIQVETMNKRWPNRKHPRLKHYDYDATGAYFITICTQNRECMLSRVVGRGLAPAVTSELEYTLWGEIAERQLLLLENRYSHLTIDRYVIMPNHIHMIAVLRYEAAGASPRPTIMDVICAYKSLTTAKEIITKPTSLRGGFAHFTAHPDTDKPPAPPRLRRP